MVVRRIAHAKVNLVLAVGPPLPAGDVHAGMHPIASWMHCIELADEVEVEPRREPPSRLEISWADDAPRKSAIDWPPEKDLARRAMQLLEREGGRPLPGVLRITKRIPVGGGLGGGSADAAAAMRAGNEAFGLGLSMARLAELSRGIGSDVAYFLDDQSPSRPAMVKGLGDQVRRLAPVRAEMVLIIPEFGCATGAVYKAFDAAPPRLLAEREVEALAKGSPTGAALFNDLLSAATRVEPRLKEVMERARRAAGVPVHMSGSGSTLFALCADAAAGDAVWSKVRAELPDVTTVRTRLI